MESEMDLYKRGTELSGCVNSVRAERIHRVPKWQSKFNYKMKSVARTNKTKKMKQNGVNAPFSNFILRQLLFCPHLLCSFLFYSTITFKSQPIQCTIFHNGKS